MASVEECRSALERLSAKLGGADGDLGKAARLDRSLTCRVTDLKLTFSGQLRDGALHDITTEPPAGKAQIRLETTSDDLLALVDGDLNFASAWARGRVKLEASIKDLLTLRKLM
ncbi:alkyl sulfatase C-terminal domain-containing protein [Yinghuangia seranimata]|uniref:alkyl sulfatase C-terminal domain-containing protein n=1 Tax=Yinghuangia seranimata TaxID=408067 RepID=UPI00248C3BF0|nr:alkyl sulfatase C-terminal domain-containing protein [Yinghuangia seranimata]MDI2131845.1 alkyl sulfatase C-terminal domain-containing protein [Yinghuangia seranimata]